jgi:hypothetical protein
MLRVPFLAAPRAWEALSGCPSATGGQVGWALLTVGDRCKPLLGARRGTAGEGERRVDLAAAAPPGVQGQGASSVTTCLVGKPSNEGAAARSGSFRHPASYRTGMLQRTRPSALQ